MITFKATATCTKCKATVDFDVELSIGSNRGEPCLDMSPGAPSGWIIGYTPLSGSISYLECSDCCTRRR